ncbi:uncharacterized protein NFIA_024100 [Aspergillus fischeri NRRL 181]|uniref:Uncharacterized protein n=1 Tax=Neosartorya fischeri (strain ATCC 1020 / DSM 3700 / CBS 544.65 / FGSC A1164 / JCM 1740 / NRRL 181 / WB 181) TaxID=331117 RepID=A1D5H7_NEOFI|nr:uncharacterized protein NFIA_024100 [Aspergillus fischeri NRRL 181]EAW22031.1 hypothetical protein NFIA_024100 [Aspergillus fischeri NRRL 181]
MVLVVVLPDPPGAAAEVGPTHAAAPDAVGRQLGDGFAARGQRWEVGVVLPGPHALGEGEELQATVPGRPQPVGFLEMSLRQAAWDHHRARPADDGVVIAEVVIQHGGGGGSGSLNSTTESVGSGGKEGWVCIKGQHAWAGDSTTFMVLGAATQAARQRTH